jgi:DNA (cytosine-5)-methyltransferase 1
MKLMSLFDGSGGFPLAASLCGIEPVYAAEVEPYPIAVTNNRFPKMKHLGDVSKVKGGEIEPVDIITFGSPCQDMSTAGKRAGLKHADIGDEETTRSGLFLEAIRIIKEMREATNGGYPRYAVWENVPGAFSSNKGEDFRTVLNEFIKIVEKDAVMPDVPKAGWPYADCYSGNGWSLAYRVFDAQYWGVPQRRRRIYLVADFRGECAGKILFEREGVRGFFETGKTPWQGIAVDAQNCAGADDRAGEVPYTLKIRSGCEGGGKGALVQKDKSATLATNNDQYLFQPIIVDSIGGKAETAWHGDTAPCLKATHYKNPPCITVSAGFCPEVSAKTRGVGYAEEQSPTLRAGAVPAVVYDTRDNGDGQKVRRLTPIECARLQGFPDLWGYLDKKESFTDEEYKFWLEVRNTYARINNKAVKDYTKAQMLSWYNKLHSDSAEYKMWGNGIALPNALYVMQGIAEVVGVHHSK